MGLCPSLLAAMGTTSAYVAGSVFLLHRPLLPWTSRKKPGTPPVKFIAHRGGAGEGYENTLETFRRAVDMGTEMLELDVHLSKDEKVVVAHDQHLLRLTGEDVMIRDRNFTDLPRMKEKVSLDFVPGEHFSIQGAAEEERTLTTLDQVLEAFPETQVNIDLKDEEVRLVERVGEVITSQGAEKRCVWGNFSASTTEMCYKNNPQVGLLFSLPRFLKLYLLFYTGLLPFVPLKETHLEIPMPSIFYNEKYRSPVGNVGLAKLPMWALRLADSFIMAPRLFRHLELRGIPTYLWVLNTEAEYSRAFSLGASGVMTDYPSRLQAFLSSEQAKKKME